MRRRLARSAARDRGAAAVEFALLLPVLLLLVFGIIDFGRALNAQITLTQAAREGARIAALRASRRLIVGRTFPISGLGGGSAPEMAGRMPAPPSFVRQRPRPC